MSKTAPHPLLLQYLHALLAELDIPAYAKRVAINFRITNYYQTRKDFPPVEVQLERCSESSQTWQIVFVASFSYPSEHASEVEIELYFNFLRGWFYQPDVEQCALSHPMVKQLYEAYERAFLSQVKQSSFDSIQATLVSIDSPPAQNNTPITKEVQHARRN
ncbi:DUF2787 family protein [Vibrio astriarenae]